VEASNIWAFYPAKTIRQTKLQVGSEILKLDRLKTEGDSHGTAVKTALNQRIDTWTGRLPVRTRN
jgi:hypothetical protein